MTITISILAGSDCCCCRSCWACNLAKVEDVIDDEEGRGKGFDSTVGVDVAECASDIRVSAASMCLGSLLLLLLLILPGLFAALFVLLLRLFSAALFDCELVLLVLVVAINDCC